MPQGRRTVQVRLPDGSLSNPYPADMPPAEILAAVEREIAAKEPKSTGDPRLDAQGERMAQLYPNLRAQQEGYGKDNTETVTGALRLAGAGLPLLVPGAGLPAVTMRTAAGVLPMVAARGIETDGDPEAMLRTAGAELALSGAGEGIGKLLSIPAVQKAAIKTAGFFTGPFSYGRNINQYDDWAESLARLNNEHGVMPAGRQSTLEKLKNVTKRQIDERLAKVDELYADPIPSTAPRPDAPEPRVGVGRSDVTPAGPSSHAGRARLAAGEAPEVLRSQLPGGMTDTEFAERLAALKSAEDPLRAIDEAVVDPLGARETLPQRYGSVTPYEAPPVRTTPPGPPDVDMSDPIAGLLPGTVTPPKPRLNVVQAVMDAVAEHAGSVPKQALRGVDSELAAIRSGSDIIADLLTRNQPVPVSSKLNMKNNLKEVVQQALENRNTYGGDIMMDTTQFQKNFGYDPFSIKPSQLHEINKGLGQDVRKLLEEAASGGQLPREGEAALQNKIHQKLRDVLTQADTLPVEEGQKAFGTLQTQYHDLMNADKFRGAVRRDPAMFPMRAGFGSAMTSGVGRATTGMGIGTALGGPGGAAAGGLLALLGLEPSVLYTLLYGLPKAGAKYGPSVIRAGGNTLRPVPSHETEE